MNPEDLQDEIKVLLRRLEKFEINSRTVYQPNPLQSLSDKILSAAYLQASESIKAKMVTLAIVGRCPFQDRVITFSMHSIIFEMTPPETFTTWTHSKPKLDCHDLNSFVEALTNFIIQPLPESDSVSSLIFDCIKLFYKSPFHMHRQHSGEKSIIQSYVNHLNRRSGFTMEEVEQLPINVRSRDASPTRK